MTKLLAFLGLDGKTKFQFMSWIGGMFIIFYLVSLTYDLAQINYFFAKGKLDIEVYERIRMASFRDLFSVVTIIVLYFFKNNAKENESNGGS